MDRLPEEILYTILQNVQSTSKQRSFFTCLLCCHLWYKIGLPLMYHGIKLRNRNLEAFLSGCPERHWASVRLLTISIKASYDNFNHLGMSHLLRLQRLTEVLPHMVNLSTFSFTFRDPQSAKPHPLQMPRSMIAAMVKHLPVSCVNLEIDTDGLDCYRSHTPHLCERLRGILPRLQHLRLRLGDLCPGIFATGFNRDGTRDDPSSITPVVAPSLKTAVINCRAGYWSSTACGIKPKTDAHVSLLPFLYEFAACGSFPVIEHLRLVYKPLLDSSAGPQHFYYKRCDIVQNLILAIPFLPGRCPSFPDHRDANYIRTPDGQAMLSSDAVLDRVAEGQTWQTTLSRHNVPTAMMNTWELKCAKPLPLLDLASYHTGPHRCECYFHMFWQNERVTGLPLLQAIQREGILDESPVRKIRPEGWRWVGNFLEPEP